MIKCFLRNLVFKEEAKKLDKLLRDLTEIDEANHFFIEQGKRTAQFQINNPAPKRIPRTLMGHGLPLAARHLGCKSLGWERQRMHEARKEAKAFQEKTGIRCKAA